MGICGSTSLEDQLSRQIDRDLSRAHRSSRDVTKMLLLGAGGSGKSTVMRQFKMLYTSGFGDAERIHMRDHHRIKKREPNRAPSSWGLQPRSPLSQPSAFKM